MGRGGEGNRPSTSSTEDPAGRVSAAIDPPSPDERTPSPARYRGSFPRPTSPAQDTSPLVRYVVRSPFCIKASHATLGTPSPQPPPSRAFPRPLLVLYFPLSLQEPIPLCRLPPPTPRHTSSPLRTTPYPCHARRSLRPPYHLLSRLLPHPLRACSASSSKRTARSPTTSEHILVGAEAWRLSWQGMWILDVAAKHRAPAPRRRMLGTDSSTHRQGQPILVDGETLSIPAVAAVARYGANVVLDDSTDIQTRVLKSRQVIVDKVNSQKSVYGVSTGFGGSGKRHDFRLQTITNSEVSPSTTADTRTNDPLTLGLALFQHQHAGVLPSDCESAPVALPLLDPLTSTSMPESWVRGAILIRMNSLIRGHSGVRWELIERMGALLRENVIPLVPLRGSISASGGE